MKRLRDALGARQLLAATGNHEVNSRAGEPDDVAGNCERVIDPLGTIQAHADYPCTCLTEEQRWVYWGRGYQLIEMAHALFLVINSSHFHPTTRQNEFERGRVSEVALRMLRAELYKFVDKDRGRAFIALMHHHPIPHQPIDMPHDRIDMINGPQLMEVLAETGVSWLVVHGHKHHGRLITSQGGMNGPIVFAAGSFGAFLNGVTATQTRLQFYILDVELCDQSALPKARGHVRAWSWTGSSWEPSRGRTHGLPDRCGYLKPAIDLEAAVDLLAADLRSSRVPYLPWEETLARQGDLCHLMPDDAKILRRVIEAKGLNTTWPEENWFPLEIAL